MLVTVHSARTTGSDARAVSKKWLPVVGLCATHPMAATTRTKHVTHDGARESDNVEKYSSEKFRGRMG
jgi:hypothetical protein